jgi:DMSO/TMAO reductase YedYZ heme-binding membrane subunit
MNTQILWFTSRATGAVSLVLFTLVMVLGIATAGRAGFARLPRAGLLRLHRSLTLTSLVFLAVHIISAIADGYVDLSYWDVVRPFGAGFDPFWIGLASVAVDLLIAVGVTSWLRLRMPASWWRAVHLSAYACWPLVILHGFGVSGGDGRQTWMIIVDVVCVIAVLAAVAYRLRPDRHPDTLARRAAETVHPPARGGRHQ